MKKFVKRCLPLADVLLSPFTLLSVLLLKLIRRAGIRNMRLSHKIFKLVGIFPIREHYYDPLFNARHLMRPMDTDRELPALNLNDEGQISLLDQFSYTEELKAIPIDKPAQREFYYHNGFFESGDAEYLYNMIRFFKPKKMIEVGSGNSTLMAVKAITKNRETDPQYSCEHTCIETYEMPWLEQLQNTKIIRKKVEEMEPGFFKALNRDDILFIDSSHVLRAQGDVEFEFLHILPELRSGVVIHIHDIFSPKDYLFDWDRDDNKLFHNEQYLLEAFLCFNREFKVIGAVNYLRHHHPERLAAKCPILGEEIEQREPGSFWIQRV